MATMITAGGAPNRGRAPRSVIVAYLRKPKNGKNWLCLPKTPSPLPLQYLRDLSVQAYGAMVHPYRNLIGRRQRAP